MNTFKQSAIEILRKAKTPLHYNEITKQALESGILETEGANPERTMNAVITVDINTKAEGSDFVRAERGVFALNQNKKEVKIVIEGGYIGKGGEHLVCSELLFRGFNASIMSVDVGVDISAIKDNKFFGIQVKTARKNSF